MAGRSVLAVVLVVAAACTPSARPPAPSASPSVAPSAARAADVDALVAAIESGHPEAFGARDEAAWRSSAAQVRARAAAMTPDEFLAAVARLANLGDRNGHTGVFPTDQPGLAMWPVRLYEFTDGWHVVAARDRSLIGARLTAVGGRPVAEVAKLLAPSVPRDNEHSLRARLAAYLVTPAFLRGVGAYGPLTVVDPSGRQRSVTPVEAPADAYATLAEVDVPQVPPALPRPGWAPRGGGWFWVTSRGGAVVAGYERVAYETAEGRRVQSLVEEIQQRLRSRPAALVVDVRRNPGGDVGAFEPMRIALRDAARAGVPVRVLIGRATYSAAPLGLFALRRAAPGVRFYGEPTGGGSRSYGSPSTVTLPASGIVVHVAGQAAAADWPAVPSLVPDVRVGTSWAAYRAGRDPVLEAALRR